MPQRRKREDMEALGAVTNATGVADDRRQRRPIAFTDAPHGRECRLGDTPPCVGDPFVAESVASRREFPATVGTDEGLAPTAPTVDCRPAAGVAIKPGVQRHPIAHFTATLQRRNDRTGASDGRGDQNAG